MATNQPNMDELKELIYKYIQQLAVFVPPGQAIKYFYKMFIDRTPLDENGARRDIRDALEELLDMPEFSDEEALKFLNRCYYSIGNLWLMDVSKRPHLEKLVGRLDDLPGGRARNPYTARLRRLLHLFGQSRYAVLLRRQMDLGGYEGYDPFHRRRTGKVRDILADNFCLYRAATLSEDLQLLHEQTEQSWWDTGIGSSQWFRLQETQQEIAFYRQQRGQGIKDVFSPMRYISTEELDQCLTFYDPMRRNALSLRARNLCRKLKAASSTHISPQVVCDYLMASIRPLPEAIYKKLRRELLTALSRFEQGVAFVGVSVINLFRGLLDAIFLPGSRDSEISVFQRFIEYAGPRKFVGVILSIVLPCPMVRFELEKKLGYLYSHHENERLEEVPWLLQFFEHINLAIVMNAEPLRYFKVV
ncbi:MAG: hypothetical protein ACFB0G_07350 [Leptolyngbyaceae cyanobacterium]